MLEKIKKRFVKKPKSSTPLEFCKDRAPRNPTTLLPEMWLEVSEYLPLEDQARLALTCGYFNHLFGHHVTKLIKKGNKKERAEFYRSLQYIRPKHIWCPSCSKYHPRQKKFNYRKRACQLDSCRFKFGPAQRLNVEWLNLHMWARKYRLSKKHGANRKIMHREAYVSLNGARALITNRFKIYPDDTRILMKIRVQIPFSWSHKGGLGRREVNGNTRLNVCAHQAGSKKLLQAASELIAGTFDNWKYNRSHVGSSRIDSSSMYRCAYCPSEYWMETWAKGQRGLPTNVRNALGMVIGSQFCLSISWYVDFGSCDDLGEAEWRALNGLNVGPARQALTYAYPEVQRGGKIRDQFEGWTSPFSAILLT